MPPASTVSARWSAGLASNTLRRGRAEALAPQDRQPAQVLYLGSPEGAASLIKDARAAPRRASYSSPAAFERSPARAQRGGEIGALRGVPARMGSARTRTR